MPAKGTLKKRVPKALLIQHLVALQHELRRPPRAQDIRQKASETQNHAAAFPPLGEFLAVFHSLKHAQLAAGIAVTTKGGGKISSRQELLKNYTALAFRNFQRGKTFFLPSSREIDAYARKHDSPNYRAYRLEFGGLDQLLVDLFASNDPVVHQLVSAAAENFRAGKWNVRGMHLSSPGIVIPYLVATWRELGHAPDAAEIVTRARENSARPRLSEIKGHYASLAEALHVAGKYQSGA